MNLFGRGYLANVFFGSKSAIKTLEKNVKYVQSYRQKHQNDVTDTFF